MYGQHSLDLVSWKWKESKEEIMNLGGEDIENNIGKVGGEIKGAIWSSFLYIYEIVKDKDILKSKLVGK